MSLRLHRAGNVGVLAASLNILLANTHEAADQAPQASAISSNTCGGGNVVGRPPVHHARTTPSGADQGRSRFSPADMRVIHNGRSLLFIKRRTHEREQSSMTTVRDDFTGGAEKETASQQLPKRRRFAIIAKASTNGVAAATSRHISREERTRYGRESALSRDTAEMRDGPKTA